MDKISFRAIEKLYPGGKKALDGLDLDVKEGEFLTLIGPSGCGKTTLLKMINALIEPTAGEIFIDGKDIRKLDIIALRRKIGYVIQQIGLFPHLNIEKNIGYVLKINGVEASKRSKRAEELIDLVGLDRATLEKYPRQLSGGQQQRIGVIRALAADPPIILMDEPFGAIDEITRKLLQEELLNIQAKLKKTIIFVTHDIEEAMKLGDRVALLNKGKLEQIATPKEMFFYPNNKFVEEFFGRKSFSSFMNTTNVLEAVDDSYSYIVFNEDKKIANIKTGKKRASQIPVVDQDGLYLGVVDEWKEETDYRDIKYKSPLKSTSSMMGSVEALFKEGLTANSVVDEVNKYLGVFSVDSGYSKIVKNL